MFRDEDEELIEEINNVLSVYSYEDILEYNDLTIAEALSKLIMDGHIILPEVKPV